MPTIIKTHMIVQRHLIINWEEFCTENKLEEGRSARHLLTWVSRAGFCGQVPFKSRLRDERDEPRKGCMGGGGGGWAGTNIVKRRNSICKNPEAEDRLVYLPKMKDDPSG